MIILSPPVAMASCMTKRSHVLLRRIGTGRLFRTGDQTATFRGLECRGGRKRFSSSGFTPLVTTAVCDSSNGMRTLQHTSFVFRWLEAGRGTKPEGVHKMSIRAFSADGAHLRSKAGDDLKHQLCSTHGRG